MPSAERTFTVQGSELAVTGGTYRSSTPMAAGKKAGRQLFKAARAGTKSIKFILRETTRGSEKKAYFYEAFINYLKEPKVITRNGVEIKITKEMKLKTCQEHQMHTVARSNTPSPASSQ